MTKKTKQNKKQAIFLALTSVVELEAGSCLQLSLRFNMLGYISNLVLGTANSV